MSILSLSHTIRTIFRIHRFAVHLNASTAFLSVDKTIFKTFRHCQVSTEPFFMLSSPTFLDVLESLILTLMHLESAIPLSYCPPPYRIHYHRAVYIYNLTLFRVLSRLALHNKTSRHTPNSIDLTRPSISSSA